MFTKIWCLIIELFDSFILFHDCARRMVTGFIRYLFKYIWFSVFQIKMKNEKQTSNFNFNVQLFLKSENHSNRNNQSFISNFIFQFIKKRKWDFGYTDSVRFSFFILIKKLKNELLKQMRINFMIIITSIVYTLFKNQFVSSPLRFSAVQWSRGHQESAV